MNPESRDNGGRPGSSDESSPSGSPALLDSSNQARHIHMLQTKCCMHLESAIKDVRSSIEALSRSHASFSHLLRAMEEFEADLPPSMFGKYFHLLRDWDGLQNFIIDLNVSMLILLEIVDAAIYDALDILDLELSLNNVPAGNTILVLKNEDSIHGLRRAGLVDDMITRIQALASVLRGLASKADGFQLPASKQDFQVSTWQPLDSPDLRDQFRYEEELDSAAGQIRMLTILPGSVGDPINCTLDVQLLSDNPVEETLSYVWGSYISKEEIQVNSRAMDVTSNLFEALSGLRHVDQPRRIWVDALCINQSNSREKSGQVRLMRRIYSTTRKAVIWLSARDPSPSEAARWTPINDLLAQCHKHLAPDGTPLPSDEDVSHLLISVLGLITTDLNIVFNHMWWRRMWIVQEAYLPSVSPEIHFKGSVFSFEDLEEAMRICSDWDPRQLRQSKRNVTRTQDPARLSDASSRQTLIVAMSDLVDEVSSSLGKVISLSLLTHTQATGSKTMLIQGAEVEDNQQTEAGEVHKLWLRFKEVVSLKHNEAISPNSFRLVQEQQALMMDIPAMKHSHDLMKIRSDKRHETVPRDRHAFTSDLLLQFEKSRATDPRDKVFALEGLMPPALGHLLRVDYGQTVESVFKRECARFFNTQGGLKIGIPFFNLLGERGVNDDVSWTLDLGISPSDASSSGNFEFRGPPNLGTVLSWSEPLPEPGQSLEDIRNLSLEQPGLKFYVTPQTLFCGGMRIDRVRCAAMIPSFDTDEPLARFVSLLREVIWELSVGSSSIGWQSSRDLGDDLLLNSSVGAFFSLSMSQSDLRSLSDEELRNILDTKIGGKYWFITEGGKIGLCYCAVEANDELSALDQSHAMFILRRAEQNVDGAPRHRILSRAFLLSFSRMNADELLEQGKLAVEQYQIT